VRIQWNPLYKAPYRNRSCLHSTILFTTTNFFQTQLHQNNCLLFLFCVTSQDNPSFLYALRRLILFAFITGSSSLDSLPEGRVKKPRTRRVKPCGMLLQCNAVRCSELQSDAEWCSMMRRVAAWQRRRETPFGILLQCIVLYCRVLQCLAACCIVLQRGSDEE